MQNFTHLLPELRVFKSYSWNCKLHNPCEHVIGAGVKKVTLLYFDLCSFTLLSLTKLLVKGKERLLHFSKFNFTYNCRCSKHLGPFLPKSKYPNINAFTSQLIHLLWLSSIYSAPLRASSGSIWHIWCIWWWVKWSNFFVLLPCPCFSSRITASRFTCKSKFIVTRD